MLECMKIDKPLSRVKICIKGITFRAGVKEFYHSRNLALARSAGQTKAWTSMLPIPSSPRKR